MSSTVPACSRANPAVPSQRTRTAPGPGRLRASGRKAMSSGVTDASPEPPRRLLVSDRGHFREAVLDRLVVALGLAQVHRDRPEGLVGVDPGPPLGHLAG